MRWNYKQVLINEGVFDVLSNISPTEEDILAKSLKLTLILIAGAPENTLFFYRKGTTQSLINLLKGTKIPDISYQIETLTILYKLLFTILKQVREMKELLIENLSLIKEAVFQDLKRVKIGLNSMADFEIIILSFVILVCKDDI